MKSSVFTIRPLCLLMVLGVFVVFIAYYTYMGSFQLTDLSGDQVHIGVMVLKQSRPELFARDYAFKDMSLFRFYTPSWRWLTKQIMSVTGDYAISLLVLMPVVMLVYLIGMFVLAYFMTGNILASILVALVSSRLWRGFPADAWGTDLTLITPRALFCMLAPWLFVLMFHWLEDSHRWKLPLLAFLGGLGANLHPVSGMIFTQLLLSMILLTQGINRKALTNLLLSALAAVAGAMPVSLNFVRHTGEGLGTIPFEVFRRVMEPFHTVFPFRPAMFFGYPLNAHGQEVMVWVYLGGMLLWGGGYLLYRRGRVQALSPKVLYGILFVLQAPVAYLLTGFKATALVVVTVFYWAYRILRSEPDRLDRWLLYLMGLIYCYCFVASYVLGYIWKHFELWSLTSLMAEQPRSARFIYLPLFLYAARFMQIAVRLGWKGYFLIVAAACLTAGASPQDLFWSVGVGLLVLGWPETKVLRDHQWAESILETAALGVTLKTVLALAGVEGSGWLALYAAVAYGVPALGIRYPARRWHLLIGTSSLVLACVAFGGTGVYRFPILSPVRSLALTPSRLWTQISPNHLKQGSYERRDDFELYDWVRSHTDIDSLFYHNSLEFRFRAQRSITHCMRDSGTAYYQGAPMLEFSNRYREFERARQEVSSLLAQAEEYEVDYIVATSSQAQPILPIAFSNSTYTVYRYDPAMAAINLHLVRGEWEEAIGGYKGIIKLSPNNTWAYFGLGRVYQAQGKMEQAEAAYLDAINVEVYNVLARAALAQVYVAQGRTEEAIRQYEEAIRLCPDYLAQHGGLGDIYLMQGRVDEAVAEYKKAISLPPGIPDYHLALGDLYSSRNLTEKAIAEYRQASALDSSSMSAYSKLGNIYRMEEKFEKAIAAYKQAITVEPQVEAYIGIGHVYKAQGKREEALAWYRKATRAYPCHAWPYLAIGDLYMTQDNPEEAMSAYQEAIEVAPDYVNGYVRLGKAYEAQEEMAKAIELFQQAAEVNSRSASPYLALGDLYWHEGDWEKVVIAYQQAIATEPSNISGYVKLGTVYKGRGEIDKAITAYQQVAIAEPTNAEPHRQLALLYEQAGLLEEAVREWVIFIALTPNGEQRRDAERHLSRLGDVLLQMLSGSIQAEEEGEIEQIEARIRQLIPNQMDVKFGNRVEFLGYEFNPLGDGQAYLDLYFKCLKRMDVDYTLWLHADAGDDSNSTGDRVKHLNFDHQLPTATWQEGMIYKDRCLIQAEPGLYHSSFGLWRGRKDSRLWRMDKPEQHHVYLGIFTIE